MAQLNSHSSPFPSHQTTPTAVSFARWRKEWRRIKGVRLAQGKSETVQVLSKLCRQPIIVYIPEHEHTHGGRSSGFIPIAEYGSEFCKGSRNRKPRKAVRLLFSGRNHYDLLV